MPVLDTAKSRAARDYWTKSQHLESLPSPTAKEEFTTHVLISAHDRTPCPIKRALLSRLIARVTPVAA